MQKQINERISKLYFYKTSISKEKRDESKARLDSIYQDINNFSNEEDRINITEKLNNILKEETSEISRIEIIDKIYNFIVDINDSNILQKKKRISALNRSLKENQASRGLSRHDFIQLTISLINLKVLDYRIKKINPKKKILSNQ